MALNKSIKIFLLLIILSIVGLLNAEHEKTILKVFDLPDPKSADAFAKADRAVIEAFKKKFPNIELQSFSGIQIENMDLDAGPLMAIAGGVSPDIIYVNFRQSATYIEKGFLYPLDEFVAGESEQNMNYRVSAPVMPVIKRKKTGDNEDHYWCMPYETLVRVLLYRKDLFQKAGLDPNRGPRDWNELYHYAKKITNPQEGTSGLTVAGGPQAAWDWITYLWSAGGEAVRQNPETGEWYASFDDEAAVTAMDFFVKLKTEKWQDVEGNTQVGYIDDTGDWGFRWSDGKIGMRIDYMDDKSLGKTLDPNLYGVAPVPLGPTGIRGSELNCRMMGIFSGAGISNNGSLGERDPEKVRQAAWNYIWFYDSEEARQIRTKVMIDAGYGKMLNPILLERYGYDEYLRYVPEGWIETFEEALENGKPEPYGKNTQKVYEYMTYPLNRCISLAEEGNLGSTEVERRENISQILKNAVKRTNQKMLGKITPDERAKRNRTAAVVAVIVFSAFLIILYRVWQIFTPKDIYFSSKSAKRRNLLAWLMLLPALLSILMWKYIPMIMGSLMAFQDYSLVGNSEWVGLSNFADVLYDPIWWKAIGKTLYYMLLSLSLGFFPPIILAILLQEVSKGKLIYRVIYYLPAIVSGVIVVYLWKLLYDPSDAGALNQILLSLGLPKSRWLQDEGLAMLLVILPQIWAGVGPGCLIYLAALKGIPDDLYEAADIDGAGFFSKIRHIVFPSMKALIIIQFIAAFIASAQQSGFILVMTFGGPNEATKVADLLIFERAYLYLNFGVATAMAWMLGFMMMGFTVFQLRRLSRMEFRTADSAKKDN